MDRSVTVLHVAILTLTFMGLPRQSPADEERTIQTVDAHALPGISPRPTQDNPGLTRRSSWRGVHFNPVVKPDQPDFPWLSFYPEYRVPVRAALGELVSKAGIVYALANRDRLASGVPGLLNKDLEEFFGVSMGTIRERAVRVDERLAI